MKQNIMLGVCSLPLLAQGIIGITQDEFMGRRVIDHGYAWLPLIAGVAVIIIVACYSIRELRDRKK